MAAIHVCGIYCQGLDLGNISSLENAYLFINWESSQNMVTSDVLILTIGLAGRFFLENTYAIKKGNPCFLDQDEKLRPNLGLGLQGRYKEHLICFFMWKAVKMQCQIMNLQNA